MRRACAQFESGFGVHCGLVAGREAIAEAVLNTSPLAALLLTSLIEWFVQLHYVAHVRDEQELDSLFRDILRFHWIDESRHARARHAADRRSRERSFPRRAREHAVDELLALGGAVDGLLAQQLDLDIDALERSIGRVLTADDKEEIRAAQQRAYRWTFLVSGLEHPKFVEIVSGLTVDGHDKVASAALALSE